MGRKKKLTPEMQKNICNFIAHGIPLGHAANVAGISSTTFYDWYRKGENAKSGRYYDFYVAVEKAKSQAVALRLDNIRKAGEDGNWQADAWWLERIDPDNFAKKNFINMESENTNLNFNFSDLFDDDLIREVVEENNDNEDV